MWCVVDECVQLAAMTGIPFDNLEIVQVFGAIPEDESVNEILEVWRWEYYAPWLKCWQFTWVKVETTQYLWPMNDGAVFYYRSAAHTATITSIN